MMKNKSGRHFYRTGFAGGGFPVADLFLAVSPILKVVLLGIDISAETAVYYFATTATRPVSDVTLTFKKWLMVELTPNETDA